MTAEPLRDVRLAYGYRLTLWGDRTDRDGRTFLRYRFCRPDGRVLFAGADFGVSAYSAIDSDDVVRSLMGFLTVRQGDTDREYFSAYTPDQLAWCEGSDAQDLASFYGDLCDGEPFDLATIEDVDDADAQGGAS